MTTTMDATKQKYRDSSPSNLLYTKGDILDMPDKGYWIAHQCNCTSSTISGIAPVIFGKYPMADTRRCRPMPYLFGTGTIQGPVINLFSQKHKGKPNQTDDTQNLRLIAFRESFCSVIGLLGDKPKIAMPELIGCGMAGGHHPSYVSLLESICKQYYDIELTLIGYEG